MIRNTFKVWKNVNTVTIRQTLNKRFSSIQTDDWFIYPRETEGNNYAVNWSLAEDGVVPVGDAFRNARLPILAKRLGVKSVSNVIETTKPLFYGDYKVLEAGDSISHDDFNELFSSQQEYLSSGIDLFVEDASLGSYNKTKIGVRVVTDDPAFALIFRNLLIPSPPRPVDHRARFDGWNQDPRWKDSSLSWTGSSYDVKNVSDGVSTGERPITAFIGGKGNTVAVQFVESSRGDAKVIVGANVSVGSSAPVSAVVEAITLATTVLANEKWSEVLAVPSLSLSKGKSSVVVVGADEVTLQAAVGQQQQQQVLVGAYGNVLTSEGVSSLWNGFVGSSSSVGKENKVPTVAVNGKAAVASPPNNLSFAVTHLCFFDKNTSSTSSLSEEEAVKKLVVIVGENKTETIKKLIKGVKLSVVGKSTNLTSLF